jgi:hypothetical protein
MISKFSGLLILRRTAICFSRTSTQYKDGALLTVWNSTSVKLEFSFSRKTNALIYDFKLCQSSITRSHSIKDMGVYIDNKLPFNDQVNYIFSQSTRLLGLIYNITFNFSSIESMFRLYIALVRSKLEYAFVIWNSITSTNASKLERTQQRFAALCLYRFFILLLLYPSSSGVKLAHPTYEEAPPRRCLSHSSLFWIQIFPLCSGNCWSPSSSSAYSRFCFVQCLLLLSKLSLRKMWIGC